VRAVIGTPVLATALLAACANSGLGPNDDDTDTDTTFEGTCPWVGTWDMTTISCGSIPATEWFDSHTGATLDLSHAATGGCDALLTLTGNSCTRTETWTFPAPTGPAVAVTFEGIASCVPNACVYETFGTPCAVGALTGTGTVDITVTGTSMSMTTPPYATVGPLVDTMDDCPLEITTDWSSAPPPT